MIDPEIYNTKDPTSEPRTSDPLVKVNSTLSLTQSTLLHRLVLLSVLLYLANVSGRYSTNWDRKG